jgi:hypothetical protein
MLGLAALLTLAAMRLVVPTGIAWWPRARRRYADTSVTEMEPR